MATDGSDRGDRAARVAAWCTLDESEALGDGDLQAIAASRTLRELVIDRVEARDLHRDLGHACLALGRLFGSFAASPSLASGTLDHLRQTLDADADASWMAPARGALAEGFLAARLERVRDAALAAWDFPACAVRLDARTVAVACGRDDEGDSLLAWADRTASALARAGYRAAYLAGRETAVETLRRALGLAGVEVQAPAGAPEVDAPPRKFGLSWLRSRRS